MIQAGFQDNALQMNSLLVNNALQVNSELVNSE